MSLFSLRNGRTSQEGAKQPLFSRSEQGRRVAAATERLARFLDGTRAPVSGNTSSIFQAVVQTMSEKFKALLASFVQEESNTGQQEMVEARLEKFVKPLVTSEQIP